MILCTVSTENLELSECTGSGMMISVLCKYVVEYEVL